MVCKNNVCKLRFAFKGNVAMNYYSITNYDTIYCCGKKFQNEMWRLCYGAMIYMTLNR